MCTVQHTSTASDHGQSVSEDHGQHEHGPCFKCRVGDYPAIETFFFVVYDDNFYARVFTHSVNTHEVWQIRIQSKLRVDVHAVLGLSVRHELVIKGDGGSSTEAESAKRRVICFTPMQHRGPVHFRPGQVFALVLQAFNRIEFAFCAVAERGTYSDHVCVKPRVTQNYYTDSDPYHHGVLSAVIAATTD
ncbi:hypothetical protein PR003_g21735 [Phytophthora rubi]|uniref:Uncharacterized protein n=1 Tax=Phytophthora rubi TaxID=129364 RepID=A0A6A4DBK7_9STRA|nr:hypothetical protein PR003_g21735 [Phytophthora rubi]